MLQLKFEEFSVLRTPKGLANQSPPESIGYVWHESGKQIQKINKNCMCFFEARALATRLGAEPKPQNAKESANEDDNHATLAQRYEGDLVEAAIGVLHGAMKASINVHRKGPGKCYTCQSSIRRHCSPWQ